MNLLRIHHDRTSFLLHRTAPRRLPLPAPPFPRPPKLHPHPISVSLSPSRTCSFGAHGFSKHAATAYGDEKGESLDGEAVEMEEDLSVDGVVYQNTLRLVECSMFAALSGLVYFLSNSLSIENYFGCFFGLPIVISSMRWGIAAGRKTMVATAVLLLVLSGPLKALTYLLMHGLLGLTIGSLWRLGASWGASIFISTLVRALCAMGYVLISSFLIRENILDLITINLHASISFLFTASGINTVPSMNLIYAIFGGVLLLNSIFLAFLLHLLYSVFLSRLGMRTSLKLPRWLEKAL
ncbi:uncharacterized protein LOC115754962 isoform X1 [Rhodamnia argentea]|uniref:Uncharacterized protein LOC115754962 isoform X1 n=1 Tax=Rhodamnia argentea TaxID=178133 RepID=A0A8B8QSN2_9MYRT|nr:uncharacterized protein LOC115754962 isoform X1 [Rhodamnia argentea]